MKINVKIVFLFLIVAVLLLGFNGITFGQEEPKVKMDEYKAELAGYQSREADASGKNDSLQAEIDELKSQIADLQSQIDSEWEEVYVLLGTDKESVEAFRGELDAIDSEIDGLAVLSPEELFQNQESIEGIEKKIEEAKQNKLAILTEMENKLASLDAKVADLKASLPANIYDQYTVIKGDYLWKISKKDEIYGDPYQWIRIYCVNKDQIKDPDLIHPDQVFNIARGVGMNEHLVVKGEWLAKIAGYANVFNDPTKWTKLYEANKDVITDQNLIYPYQVLAVPSD